MARINVLRPNITYSSPVPPGYTLPTSNPTSQMLDPQTMAQQAVGSLPNPEGYTMADAQVVARLQAGLPVSDTARSSLLSKAPPGSLGDTAATGGPIAEPLFSAQSTTPAEPEIVPPPGPAGQIRVQLPDGRIQSFSQIDQSLNQALLSGGKLVRSDGSTVYPEQFEGGWLADNMPLNVWLGQEWEPGQLEALRSANRTPPAYIPETPSDTGGPAQPGGSATAQPAAPTVPPLDEAGNVNTDLFNDLFNIEGPPDIPQITFPQAAQVPGQFSADTLQGYQDVLGRAQQDVGGAYDYAVPYPTATEWDLSQVPRPVAREASMVLPQSFPALEQLLEGQGFDPQTLAAMRSRAIEDVSGAGVTQMSQAKRALGQAGLAGSPAGVGVQSQIARDVGRQQTSALRDIDIQNALQGVENLRLGAGLESNRLNLGAQLGQQTQLSNMQQANAMALANASNMLSAMQQNAQFRQESTMAQFGAEQGRQQSRAAAQSDIAGRGQMGLLGAQLGKQASADEINAAREYDRQQQQAQFQRQADIFNRQVGEQRWGTGMGLLGGLAGAPNVAPFTQPSPMPVASNPWGQALSNFGTTLLDRFLGQPRAATT